MSFEEISVYCELHQGNLNCSCVSIQNIQNVPSNIQNESKKDDNYKTNKLSIARQCFAAIIGKFCIFINNNRVSAPI